MNSISKSFLVASAILLLTSFVPNKGLYAAIFDGSESDTGVRYGICLSEDARTNENHPDYDECRNVNCDNPSGEDEIAKCTPETQAGTGRAKDSLAGSGITHTDSFRDFVLKLVNFALPYLTLAAFLGYVIAGFLYVTALGNDEQMGKAKKILLWSSVGLILVILSYTIVRLLTTQLVEAL